MTITATRPTASRITATRPTATSINAGGGGEVCRNVLTLNGTSVSNIDASPQDLTTEFEVRMITELSTDCSLFGFDENTFYVRVFGSDRIGVYDGGSFGISGFYSGDLLDGTHEIVIKTSPADRIEIFVDGEDLGVLNTRSFTSIMNMFIGSHNSTIRHLNGRMYSFEMWNNGTSDTGTKIIDLNLQDGAGSSTVLNTGTLGGSYPLGGVENVDYAWSEECEGDASAWNDPEGFNDPEEWND